MTERARRRLSGEITRSRALTPRLEGLEGRFLLYATTGTQWAKPKRITYSFVPDGTNIGGVPSNLQQTLNARFTTAAWQGQFAAAAAVWQKVAKVNFWPVSDDGSPLGVSGNQQNDARFGDIRIGGYAMSGSILAFAYLAPPANGGTNAGDMLFNTTQSWQINGTTYDLMTVAIHEFGHALGMGHATDTVAAMYPAYNATKESVNADDTAGIRTIYNSRQNDFFDANGSNDSSRAADNITSYIDGNAQLTISALDSTTPMMIGTNDTDWFKVTVPASTTGTMVVRMQSTKLSLLAPTLSVYNSTGATKLGEVVSYNAGDTVTVTISNVSAGQVYNIKCKGSTTGGTGFGTYGLQVNFGSLNQPAVTAPDTTMAEATDLGGGTMSESTDEAAAGDAPAQDEASLAIPGVPTFWVYSDDESTVSEDNGIVGSTETDETEDPNDTDPSAPPPDDPTDSQVITVGTVTGFGDALMIDAETERALKLGTASDLAPWTPLWRPSPSITIFRPALAANPLERVAMTTLDFLVGNDQGKAFFPISPRPRNRSVAPPHTDIVDRALIGLTLDPTR